MKAKLTTIFIVMLTFCCSSIHALIQVIELNKIEGAFSDLVNYMYVLPLVIALSVTNLVHRSFSKK